MAAKLTAIAVEKMEPGRARREVPDGHVAGLYLLIQPSGAKSWACRYRLAGKPSKLTLGAYPAVDLKTARGLAQRALVEAASGLDPSASKRTPKAAAPALASDAIEIIVADFIAQHARPNNRASTAREAKRVLAKEVVARWRGRRLSDITSSEVREMLREVVARGSPISANRLLAVFQKLCAWGVANEILPSSPCEKVEMPTAIRSRDRVLSDGELRRIWSACNGLGWPFGPLTQLLILTATRRDEVGALRWAEIDIGAAIWILPKHRAKNGVEHSVPLSQQALAILTALPRVGEEFVFTTNARNPVSGFSRSKLKLDRLIADEGPPLPPWTIHDLRRTAATGMARLGVSLPVVEKILNHVSGSFRGVAGIYNRHTYDADKRVALKAWADHVQLLVS